MEGTTRTTRATRTTLSRRADISLASFERVAWDGEAVDIDPSALELIARRREQFLAFLAANADRKLYGINVHAGDSSDRLLSADEQRDYERGLHTGTSFGAPLPQRVTRGIVLARLANFIEGHAAVTPELVTAVANRLDGRELPPVPRYGNGGSGEIQALGWLFSDVPDELRLGLKEGMALINGSPCAAALLADAILCCERALAVAEAVFCLAAAAIAVPPATYDRRLDALWGDSFQAEALAAIRAALAGADSLAGEQHPQPPSSFRILPRVLGNARRVIAAARSVADSALGAVTDNPVFLFPEAPGELGDVVSTGGFHDGAAPVSIDTLTFALADLSQLATHQVERLQTSRRALPAMDSLALGTMQMVAGGFAEEARTAAVPSLLPMSGFGQSDTPSPTFFAWNRFDRVRGFLTGSLTCLAVLAAQALALPGRAAPPALAPLLAEILAVCPPIAERRFLGPELEQLSRVLTPAIPE
jgi:histidine ammonia-lyase